MKEIKKFDNYIKEEITEGPEITNQKFVTSERPNVMPAPQGQYKKTRFSLVLNLRIARDSASGDKFTEEFVIEEIMNGNAIISRGKFILWTKNNNQVMAEIESIN
jgi:hypothetical protein